MSTGPAPWALWREFWALTKPRVVSLIVFTAMIGMFLARVGMPDWGLVALASVGIGLVAGSAAAINCLVEQHIDARMARTRARPLPRGMLSNRATLIFAMLWGGLGLWILGQGINVLTMVLTLATFVGYAIIYTLLLKPNTPQNIVIGGASGAMPPVLGWAAMTGHVAAEAWILFLIIFIWTPPHFWALALYRQKEYAASGLPMLPVTHGPEYTRLQVLLYTLMLCAVSLLPTALHFTGWIYLLTTAALNVVFLAYAWRIYRHYSDALARRTFAFSILYLSLLFAGLLVDHYLYYPFSAYLQ